MVAKIFWPEDSRDSEAAILKKVEELAKGNPTVDGHVPEVLFVHKFENSTAELRRALGIANPQKGSRTLYIIVFRKLSPITDLSGAEFLSAWWDCVLCHRDLWKGGVHHRDISAGNLMYYRNRDGVVVGVLNDFDLATFVIGKGPTGNQRTGTVPFMARQLLTKEGLDGEITHVYRHEVESFIWVLVWVSLRLHQGHERNDKSRCLDLWLKADEEQCRKEKNDFLLHHEKFSPSFAHKDNWVLAKLFLRLLLDQDRKPFSFDGAPVSDDPPDDVIFAEFKEGKDAHDAWMRRRVLA
ncbi:hypothetical protein BV22DRAFT_264501 [Leucogyrophana mollusca]|uniref:Uncharacterized protein n=1 Tax=Leucogyrophana mollusca TaxID=85980 RepID=A0ACB8BPJ2_9AGAM|nr:hypothetical protein BV22DRAFT_264501 [Leucogyrophana mollusca]